MTKEKLELITKMFSSIGHELMHYGGLTERGQINIYKGDYLNLVTTKCPKCIIYDYRHKTIKKLTLPSYKN